jgi:hypothetical protein
MMTERGDVHHHGGRATLFLGYAVAHGVWVTEPSRDERHRNAGPFSRSTRLDRLASERKKDFQ